MRLAVIDTNVIIAAYLTRHDDSATRRIVDAVFSGVVTPVVTPGILAEYRAVMSRPKFGISGDVVNAVCRYFGMYGRQVTPLPCAEGLADEKDRIFLEAALAARPDGAVLVTGNTKHFPAIVGFVMSPTDFAASL